MRTKNSPSRLQAGFTLIELIIVIVIVGILAAVAIPKYLSLAADAAQASLQAVGGNLAAASATNFAIRSGFPAKGSAVAACADVATLMQGGVPADMSIAGTAPSCTVNYTAPKTGVTAVTFAIQTII